MRKAIPILLFLILCGCENNESGSEFTWLIGERTRINGDSSVAMTEKWEQKGNEYIGHATSIKEGASIFHEDLRIFKQDSFWFYEVSGVHEKPVHFKMTSITDSSFISENPDNDFPKKIAYRKVNNRIVARISDDNEKIEFIFK